MPHWRPKEEWEGEDAYIIGGGPSLSSFDWKRLHGKNTIGCNSAFILGHEVCKILLFGDILWWDRIGKGALGEYGGRAVACTPRAHPIPEEDAPWLLTMERQNYGKWGTGKLCWTGNTGGMAINLALILGARRVFLLGFDMQQTQEHGKVKNNWHDLTYEATSHTVYTRFKRAIDKAAKSLDVTFPGRQVINVSDCSQLEAFPIVSLEKHFGKVVA